MVAGGYLADIPSEKIDLFVAGCSCVDYSNLNNARAGKTDLPVFNKYPPEILNGREKSPAKVDSEFVSRLMETLDTLEVSGTGESMRTFLSAMSYIVHARPKIVIMENVDSAPWSAKTNFWFPRAGYVAAHTKVNSKMFYLPQTRQRGYLVAADVEFFGAQQAETMIQQSTGLIKELERQASSPVTKFLLGPDDARLVGARGDMEQRSAGQKDSEWGYSQVRHEAARREAGLPSSAHPFSKAIFSHGRLMRVTPPARSWIQYFKRQPPRVLDFIDIVMLKSLQMKCDLRYKTWVLDVSQNVDRSSVFTSSMASKFGTINCITPSGQPILTDQMRPITGLEALGLQGLPIDDLVLSTETQAQLQDLAGNAMTVPVVGAVILAALTAAHGIIQGQGPAPSPSSLAAGVPLREYPKPEESYMEPVDPWDLGNFHHANLSDIIRLAARGLRLCFCPNPEGPWLECADCGATACQSCRDNPRHSFSLMAPRAQISRAELQLQIGGFLPGAFDLFTDPSGVAKALFAEDCSGEQVNNMCQLLDHNVFYREQIRVTENITVEYKSARLVARLVLQRTAADWLLFARRRETGTNSTVHIFNQPVARGRFAVGSAGKTAEATPATATVNPADATWSVWSAIPCAATFRLCSSMLPRTSSAGAQIAISLDVGEEDWSPPSGFRAFPKNLRATIEREVFGPYWYKPRCGGPEDSLYAQTTPLAKHFLFKEVASTGAPEADCFIFSADNRQLEAEEYREVALRTSETAMPAPGELKYITAHLDGYWVACKSFFAPANAANPSVLPTFLAVSNYQGLTQSGWRCCETKPATLLRASIRVSELPLPLATIFRWANGRQNGFYVVSPLRLDSFLRDISFASPGIFKVIASRLPKLSLKGRGMEVQFCKSCYIQPPKSYWHNPDGTSAAQPWESPDDVEKFEKRLKQLPSPLSSSVRFSGDTSMDSSSGVLDLHFSFNARTLPSRAMAHLAFATRTGALTNVAIRTRSRVFCEVDWQYRPVATSTFEKHFVPFHSVLCDSSSSTGLDTERSKAALDQVGS